MTSTRVVPSAALSAAEWSELTDLCVAAFDEPWDRLLGVDRAGRHVITEDHDGRILAHAAIVDRFLYPGNAVLRAGYVEAVAVRPSRQRTGLGGSHDFHARLGWVVGQGPTWIRERNGQLLRSPEKDGGIAVRRTPATPPGLDLLTADRDRLEAGRGLVRG